MTVWQAVFWVAAAYNLVIGLPSMLRGAAGVESRIVGVLVSGFGVVYALVASDPVRFGPVLWAGVLGKIGVVALMGPVVAKGAAPKAVGWVLAGDALFTVLFLAFLLG